jgi:hypothetical protein
MLEYILFNNINTTKLIMFMNVDTKLMSNSYMHKEHTCIYVVAYVWIIFSDGPDSEGKWGLCESIEPGGGGFKI